MDPADSLEFGVRPEEVDRWFQNLGYERHVVGKSLLGRELVVYSKQWVDEAPARHLEEEDAAAIPPPAENTAGSDDKKTVLFQSLVHGNEPLGLLALLHTASTLSSGSTTRRISKLLETSDDTNRLELVFFPIVNPDAYLLNLNALREKGQFGCRRTNMRAICSKIPSDEAGVCPQIPDQGIDINRNFDADHKSSDFVHECPEPAECCSAHPGDAPFSEPESRAIREVVHRFRPDAAISYHSQDFEKTSILLYPFASPVQHAMKEEDRLKFDSWGRAMEPRAGLYNVGDPFGALGYRASGTCLDWMYASEGVTVFVLESASPCGNRWCDEKKYGRRMRNTARMYAQSGATLVELVLGESPRGHFGSGMLAFLIVAVLILGSLSERRVRGSIMRLLRIVMRRRDNASSKIEMQRLV